MAKHIRKWHCRIVLQPLLSSRPVPMRLLTVELRLDVDVIYLIYSQIFKNLNNVRLEVLNFPINQIFSIGSNIAVEVLGDLNGHRVTVGVVMG